MNEENRKNIPSDENVVYPHETDKELEAVIHDLGQMIDKEYDDIIAKYEHLEERAKEHKIPSNLNRSIREMCADAEKKEKKQSRKRIINQLAKACAIVLLVGTVTFTSFAPQAEAMRMKLYDIIIEQFDGHFGIEFNENENTQFTLVDNVIEEEERAILRETFDPGEEILYPEKMFEGFNLYKAEKILNDYDLYFKNDADKYILVQVCDGSTKMYPDSEQSNIKEIIINDQSALLSESAERFDVYFYTDDKVIVMSLSKTGISVEYIIESAESIKKIII